MTSKEMVESWYKVLLYIDWKNKNDNEETNNEYKVILQDLDKLEKLEIAIKAINDICDFKVKKYEENYTLEYRRNSITSFDINKKLYELLKEVLENEEIF